MNASRSSVLFHLGSSALLVAAFAAFAEDPAIVRLPKPDTDGGKPLMQTLRERRSTREFSRQPLTDQQLSNLLWAAFGVNRPDGHRTAPSTMNLRCIDLYVGTADGLFLFDADAHVLKRVMKDDVRAATGGQDFVRDAPVELIFVADEQRMAKVAPPERTFYAAADTGFISQNVYLFCAAENLATVVHAVDQTAVAKAMKLNPDQKVVLAQAVGHPKP